MDSEESNNITSNINIESMNYPEDVQAAPQPRKRGQKRKIDIEYKNKLAKGR